MRAVGVIPARFAATRFPGKPLAPIAGKPLVQRVWEGARAAKRLERVLIATDDERIAAACRGFGAEAVLTAAHHPTGTDRIAEAAAGLDADVVVNVQGDEPLIEGHVIDAALAALDEDPGAALSTVAHPAEPEDLDDPNRVKLVLDRRGRALYFSRSRIPYPRQPGEPGVRWLQHVGLYAYRRPFLLEFVRLAQTPLERCEALEQLRALEHGIRIRTLETRYDSIGVDTPDDLDKVRHALSAIELT